MEYYKNWETELLRSLYTQKQKGLIHFFNFSFNPPLDDEWAEKSKKQNLSTDFIDFYKLYNGLQIMWSGPNHIGGAIEFLEIAHILQDWKDILYDEHDLQENDLLEFYKPFCQISETYTCGFLITPNFVAESIYCHNAPETDLYSLDLNFNGFLEMARASYIYHYWPKVLLDIQSGNMSLESEVLKTNLTKVFSGFNWADYVRLYNSFRLSNS